VEQRTCFSFSEGKSKSLLGFCDGGGQDHQIDQRVVRQVLLRESEFLIDVFLGSRDVPGRDLCWLEGRLSAVPW